jgi:hypothetical protein
VCQGPYEAGTELFCLSYWVKCDKPAASASDFDWSVGSAYGTVIEEDYSVADDLVSQAWAGWFGW